MKIVPLHVAGAESATPAELRSGKTSLSDLGEAASIAYSLHHGDCTFVTNDVAAALQSLRELRRRTITFFPFVARLVEGGALDLGKAERLASRIQTMRDWNTTSPTWWQAFRAPRTENTP